MIISLIASFIVFIAMLVTYYIYVQKPLWSHRQTVVAYAWNILDLAEVTSVHRFVTDQAYDIILGTDKEGHQWYIATLNNEEIDRISIEDVINKSFIEEQLTSQAANVKILRILPGIWEGQWVWEVFYKMEEDGGVRHRYNYYDITDGSLLETYRLRLER